MTAINSKAFYGCNALNEVVVWGMDTAFANPIFSNLPTIYCYEFSDTEYWATEQGYNVVYLDNFDLNAIRVIAMPESMELACGSTQGISVSVFPKNDNPEVAWESSDPTIVSVNNGTVTANAPGEATVTASIGDISTSIRIKTYVVLEDFNLSDELWVIAKEAIPIEITSILPLGAETEIAWASGDTSIAEVDENGLVTGKKPGDVTITAQDKTGICKTTVVHVCYPVTAIDIQPVVPIQTGCSFQLIANVTMRSQSCINRLVTFTSDNEDVVKVSNKGLITAVNPGKAVITVASENGVSSSCEITVIKNLNSVLTLPVNLTSIDSEAFAGLDSADAVRIPVTVTVIAEDAFKDSDIVILAPKGSCAIQWAKEHDITYVEE